MLPVGAAGPGKLHDMSAALRPLPGRRPHDQLPAESECFSRS